MRYLNYIVIVWILLLTQTSKLRANIGETIDQCTARYGAPLDMVPGDEHDKLGNINKLYSKYPFIDITCTFDSNGKCVSEEYRIRKDVFETYMCKALFDAESGGANWVQLSSDDPTRLSFVLDSTHKIGLVSTPPSEYSPVVITFVTKEYMDAVNKSTDAQQDETMKAFK